MMHDDELQEAFSAMLERKIACSGCGGLGHVQECAQCRALRIANQQAKWDAVAAEAREIARRQEHMKRSRQHDESVWAMADRMLR